jgi:hypothetical protein
MFSDHQQTIKNLVLASFPCYEETDVGIYDLSPVCVSVYSPYQPLNVWTNFYETLYVYHGAWAHIDGILHKSLPLVYVSVCVFTCIFASQRLGELIPTTTNASNNRRIVVRIIFYAAYIV